MWLILAPYKMDIIPAIIGRDTFSMCHRPWRIGLPVMGMARSYPYIPVATDPKLQHHSQHQKSLLPVLQSVSMSSAALAMHPDKDGNVSRAVENGSTGPSSVLYQKVPSSAAARNERGKSPASTGSTSTGKPGKLRAWPHLAPEFDGLNSFETLVSH